MATTLFTCSFLVFYFFSLSSGAREYVPCFERNIRSIPSDHLMSTKQKPLVIGHRGNPRKYQENTLDGFKSLLHSNVDGFELDIYLTKDKELVVFHDENTMRKTGVSKLIWESTAEELTQLQVKTSINYGRKVFNYTKPRPIPKLKDVLKAMKNSDKLMYLEIKPNRLRNLEESLEVGTAVAEMVTEMGLAKRVVVNSFDPLKTFAVHRENPEIPTGSIFHPAYWNPQAFKVLYYTALKIPGIKDCIKRAPNGTEFIEVMFKYGDIVKFINASFVDIDYRIFSADTFQSLRKYYSPNVSAGAFTFYDIKMDDEKEFVNQDAMVDSLVVQKAQRLITDDIDRMLRNLNRLPIKQTPKPSMSSAPTEKSSILYFFTYLVLLWIQGL